MTNPKDQMPPLPEPEWIGIGGVKQFSATQIIAYSADLRAHAAAMAANLGLARLALERKAVTLASCEAALAERDERVTALTAKCALAEASLIPTEERAFAAEARVKELEARKDAAYLERNQVVAALAKCFPSGVGRTAIEGWSEDWHGCVYIDLPTGQASWHFHDSQSYLFANLPPYTGKWDGHDTPEKYRRIAALPLPEQCVSSHGPQGCYRVRCQLGKVCVAARQPVEAEPVMYVLTDPQGSFVAGSDGALFISTERGCGYQSDYERGCVDAPLYLAAQQPATVDRGAALEEAAKVFDPESMFPISEASAQKRILALATQPATVGAVTEAYLILQAMECPYTEPASAHAWTEAITSAMRELRARALLSQQGERGNPAASAGIKQAKERLLGAIPYFRKAVADAKAKGIMKLAVLAENPDGSGTIEMKFKADDFFLTT